MSYETVINQVKTVPEECLNEISNYIAYIVYRYENDNDFNAETKAALEEVEQMKKNPLLGKSYNDVDAMMQELLA